VLAVALGLLVAGAYGAGDYLGGRASSKSSTPGVLLMSQASAAIGAIAVALAFSATVTTHDLVFGALAGAFNVLALGSLYQGLSTGRMSLVAPITAVVGSIFPITWGIIEGERPSTIVIIGAIAAVCAGALIGIAHTSERTDGAGVAVFLAIAAGLGFGISFILFAKTAHESGNWPVLTARISAVVVVSAGIAVLARRQPIRFPQGRDRWVALAAGALDVAGTTLLLLAVRHGLIVVVAPVAALGPAFTVVLAWAILKEHISRLQLTGLLIALPALMLIATG